MPLTKINNHNIYYEVHGDREKPALFMGHSLLWDSQMFHNQVEYFKDNYCIVIYDFRGQGRSELTTSRSVSIEDCYEDTLGLIDFLNFKEVHYFGQSMGGMVGLRLAIRCPERISSLIIAGSGAGEETLKKKINYWALVYIAKTFGLKLIRKKIMSFMFGNTSLSSQTFKAELKYWDNHLLNADTEIHRACIGVIERKSVAHQLNNIQCPTLIFTGQEDIAIPPGESERMHAKIPHCKLVYIPLAGHSPVLECPTLVNQELESFLSHCIAK